MKVFVNVDNSSALRRVTAADCRFGQLKDSDPWILQWLEENFEEYVDGIYVRFYRNG